MKRSKLNITIPKISFVLPVRDCEVNLAKTIRSLLEQTLKEIEIIIIDDYSKDDSLEIIRYYQNKDIRVRVLNNRRHRGAAHCRNKGNELAKANIICVADAGDENHPSRAEITYEYFKKNPEIDIFSTGVTLIDDLGTNLWCEFPQPIKKGVKISVSHPTVAYKKEVTGKVKYRTLTKESDLYESFILDAVFKKGFEFGFIPNIYVKKRRGTKRNLKEAYAYRREIYKEYDIPIPELLNAYI